MGEAGIGRGRSIGLTHTSAPIPSELIAELVRRPADRRRLLTIPANGRLRTRGAGWRSVLAHTSVAPDYP